ncbi:hypothetical protein KRMM14A1004_61300 [Krasilnikovia sp. MM14-A1004]
MSRADLERRQADGARALYRESAINPIGGDESEICPRRTGEILTTCGRSDYTAATAVTGR